MPLQWKFFIKLSHCGLVMPYGDIDLGQHWLRYWLAVWRHQAITWTNVDLSSVKFCANHVRSNKKVLMYSICKMSLEHTLVKLLPDLPGINELTLLMLKLEHSGRIRSIFLNHCKHSHTWELFIFFKLRGIKYAHNGSINDYWWAQALISQNTPTYCSHRWDMGIMLWVFSEILLCIYGTEKHYVYKGLSCGRFY